LLGDYWTKKSSHRILSNVLSKKIQSSILKKRAFIKLTVGKMKVKRMTSVMKSRVD